jgi:uncharacterized membrane protein YidH (DUF202 family)
MGWQAESSEEMSPQTETYLIAAICFISGALIIWGRNWFADSFMDMLRGLKTDRSSERLRGISSIGLAIFGIAVIIIGIVTIVAAA